MKVLILSDERDKTCDVVCSYLYRLQVPFIRINSITSNKTDVVISGSSNEISVRLKFEENIVDLKNIKKTWFRRGLLYLCDYESFLLSLSELDQFIENESNTLKGFLYESMSANQKINDPTQYNYNKLRALSNAVRVGFNIPNTIISRKGNEIREFIDKNERCITKSIQDFYEKHISNHCIIVGEVSRVNLKDVSEDSYWYSLFQQEVSKKYELRVFYFCGKIYAMAIFSQLDKNSELDYRAVSPNDQHPNRMVPYKLHKDIKKKIEKLMKLLKLESGSLDFIVTPDNQYYFLEVNPVGQFNYLSELCNYYIERDIAKYLAK